MDTKQQLSELYKAFEYFNKNIFRDVLPKVIIVLQTRGNKPAYGWITCGKVWKGTEENKIEKYEISISTEYIKRENIEILSTLIHEMVHLYNLENGIKDVSRQNRYHNKKFLQSALKFGMIEEGKHAKIGYLVKADPDNRFVKYMVEHFDSIGFNSISRIDFEGKKTGTGKEESNSNQKKYVVLCEDCGTKATFTMHKSVVPTECICSICGSIVRPKERE